MIEGTIPALLTPFTAGGEVDFELLDAHVAWLAEQGVRAVSPMGTTGEGASLSLAERKTIVDRLVRHPSGVAVLAGTGCSALPETVELSRYALDAGAAAVLIAPPWYFPATPAGTRAYFEALLAALGGDARVFPYHVPSFTGVPIEDDVLRLPGIAGAKDSGGVLAHTVQWLQDFPQLTILPGSDAFATAVYAAGARGTITLLANVFPDRLEAIRRGEDIDANQAFLVEARETVEGAPRHAAMKYLLHRRTGLPRSFVRPPLEELTPEHEARLGAIVV